MWEQEKARATRLRKYLGEVEGLMHKIAEELLEHELAIEEAMAKEKADGQAD